MKRNRLVPCTVTHGRLMYLPYKSDQEADARQLMVDMFDLVLPEKVSEEVIKKAKKGTSKTRADHCY